MQSWETGRDFRDVLAHDTEISRYLTAEDLDRIFDLEAFLTHIDEAFERVGLSVGETSATP
jgi:adenylosuccinate lyase